MSRKFNLQARDYLDTPDRKKQFNEEHFAESAARYDIATRGLSLGRDRSWKRLMVKSLPEAANPVCVDVACGTGDVAFLLAETYPRGEIIGVDLTREMIDLANRRNRFPHVRFECREMSRLALPDDSVDILTGSYALRNAPDLGEALAEFRRVVKPGGLLAFLDFSKPESPLAQAFQYRLLRFWGGFWGLALHANPEVHGYISQSLKKFPDAAALEGCFAESGFEIESTTRLFGGMMALHLLSAASKPEKSTLPT